jgi:hypothetical protein
MTCIVVGWQAYLASHAYTVPHQGKYDFRSTAGYTHEITICFPGAGLVQPGRDKYSPHLYWQSRTTSPMRQYGHPQSLIQPFRKDYTHVSSPTLIYTSLKNRQSTLTKRKFLLGMSSAKKDRETPQRMVAVTLTWTRIGEISSQRRNRLQRRLGRFLASYDAHPQIKLIRLPYSCVIARDICLLRAAISTLNSVTQQS